MLHQPGGNKPVSSSYSSRVFFQPLSSHLAYPGVMNSADSVNSKTAGAVGRISSTIGKPDTLQPMGSQQRRQWHPTPVLLPGKSHGQRSLVGCSPWGRKQLDTTNRLHFYFSLSCIGEGNGSPLQCSCLENPRDGGAAISGVAQSQTRLK